MRYAEDVLLNLPWGERRGREGGNQWFSSVFECVLDVLSVSPLRCCVMVSSFCLFKLWAFPFSMCVYVLFCYKQNCVLNLFSFFFLVEVDWLFDCFM